MRKKNLFCNANTESTERKERVKGKLTDFVQKHEKIATPVMGLMVGMAVGATLLSPSGACFAIDDGDWSTIASAITKWISRISALAVIWGGIEFGLGFRSDNPDQKMSGIKWVAAGIIIATVSTIGGNALAS